MKLIIDYFEGQKRFYLIMIILILMWVGLMVLFYLKADEVTKDPCSICAERMGEKVTCRTNEGAPITLEYYPNYTIFQSSGGLAR